MEKVYKFHVYCFRFNFQGLFGEEVPALLWGRISKRRDDSENEEPEENEGTRTRGNQTEKQGEIAIANVQNL